MFESSQSLRAADLLHAARLGVEGESDRHVCKLACQGFVRRLRRWGLSNRARRNPRRRNRQCRNCFPTRASTRRRRWPCRPRPKRWPTSRCSIRIRPPATPWPCWTSIPRRRVTAPRSRAWRCPAPATSCTTSDGTRAARACARTRRTRTCSGATSWCRACDRRGFTFSTPCPTRGSRAWSK